MSQFSFGPRSVINAHVRHSLILLKITQEAALLFFKTIKEGKGVQIYN